MTTIYSINNIVYYRAAVFNSIPSSCTPVSVDINLLEDTPGPVGNLQLLPGNVSVTVSWSRPLLRNGMISGYTISLDGSVVFFFFARYIVQCSNTMFVGCELRSLE